MAKKVKTQVKMLIKAGAANPAPPVGSTLGPFGINLMDFCKGFNDQTAGQSGMIPALVTIYEDRSFDFVIKTPPVAELVKQTLKIKGGAGNPLKDKVGEITEEQLREIATKKMPDLNCYDVDQAMQMVAGTCRSMGVKVPASVSSVAA
jgi:large subunit ribosomal protein L11